MTEKRFWLVPIDYYGEQRFVRDNTLIGEKSMSNQEVVDLLNEQDERVKELEQFKLSIISFAECNENINRRTLNDLIELIDYDRE